MKAMLGKKYREKLHGLEGIATARTDYLTGCSRVNLEYVKEGEVKHLGVDEPLLEDLGEAPVVVPPEDEKDRGGPRPMVPRA